ncbi:MAG: N-acetyl-gamma-glutamyl-phosphate reductase [Spirochaetaceae bacterium]|jgi:N-acetyl-gamma-glutamyl-phosphate reductase|nr:N-acetyl-gamma-glutamyl-phosphate reductase [Spirochaetaceae bacterium]
MTAGIIGATGYVGIELFRLLLNHPGVEKIGLSSVSFEGKNIEDIYPNLFTLSGKKTGGVLSSGDDIAASSDILFTALPNGLCEEWAAKCVGAGKRMIDLSADFRFGDDEGTYKKYYKTEWKHPALHGEAVYGLPELYRAEIARARIVGNPGCYVTSATLALLPALQSGCVRADSIIVDGKSGVSGAGRKAEMAYQFTECGESLAAYSVGTHRHEPEILRNVRGALEKFSASGGDSGRGKARVLFIPHLVPMSRGVFTTVYAPLSAEFAGKEGAAEKIHGLYENFYRDEPFVRVLPPGKIPATRNVRFSNYCDINTFAAQDTLVVTSCLDNMVKGAAGQAVQCMNIMAGLEEDAGLTALPPAF